VNPNSTNPVYTLPKARRGGSVVVVVDVLELNSATNLNFVLEHKKKTDTTWTTAGSFTPITASGVYTLNATGLKEQLRLASSLSPLPSAGESYRYFPNFIFRP